MTQAPIDPRHWDKVVEIGERGVASELAQTLANLEKARADLAEIDRIAVSNSWPNICYASDIRAVAAIAAPYRASDPVAEALKKEAREIVANMPGLNALQSAAYRDGNWDEGGSIGIALAALKRGMELASEGDR